ncbi:E3 ubiquitin-protein ligase Midline-1-like [Hydractinia symbiolongicarpus]|uniref:E3 ubiquitin-protein ligase Midline-1-like n=1 Tax=Hydractinia symbiolongicarpus TaxID=13093 RepID=UPI002549EB27|nr:E3 ubiquitin-protein ligase Midline-1-like [Hydractinia symbiolongicarpus]
MAASKVDLTHILECKICLDTYHKPKQLTCGHSYCQDCLDSILVFNNDGSAELPCPLRCNGKTLVNQHETTASLVTAYTLNDLLDQMPVGKINSPLCQQSELCHRNISCFCTKCSVKICDRCQSPHSCTNKSFTNVSFNEKLKELQPLCKQHNSIAKFVCIDCENLFTCVYCTHRQHKNHRIKSIDEFGVEAKNWFQSFINSFDETKVVLEKLTRKYGDALKKIEKEREALALKLKERKLKRLEQFLKMLNKEEEDLLKSFDEKSKEFKAKLISAGFVDNTNVKEFRDYIQSFNLKSHFELVAEKIEIERQLRRLSSFPKIIPAFKSYLYEMNKEDFLVHPLGEMKIFFCIDNITTVGLASSEFSVYKNVIDESKAELDHSQLSTDLMKLVEYLKEYEKPLAKANIGSRKQLVGGVKRKDTQKAEKKYTFDDVMVIIQNSDVKMLQTILIDDPTIVEMRDNMEATLLMEAALHNKPSIVKSLIDAGSDVYAANKYKHNAYHYSAYFAHHEVLNVLINHDVTNINNVSKYNSTPLHYASSNDHIECVKLLFSVPHIDVNIRNYRNETAYDVTRNDTIKRLLQEHRMNNN